MKYTFDFGWLLEYYPQIAKGIAVTLELIAIGGVLGIALGIVCAWVRALGPKWLRPPVATYVELIRNTPFLIQLFFIFSTAVAWPAIVGTKCRQHRHGGQSRRL